MKNQNTIDTILSVTGKTLGKIFFNHQGFGYDHFSGSCEQGFATWQEAYDAFMTFHNDWFENNCN